MCRTSASFQSLPARVRPSVHFLPHECFSTADVGRRLVGNDDAPGPAEFARQLDLVMVHVSRSGHAAPSLQAPSPPARQRSGSSARVHDHQLRSTTRLWNSLMLRNGTLSQSLL